MAELGAHVPVDVVQLVPIVNPLGIVMMMAVLLADNDDESENGAVMVRLTLLGVSNAIFSSLLTAMDVMAAATYDAMMPVPFSILLPVLVVVETVNARDPSMS